MTSKSQDQWIGDPAALLRVGQSFRLVDVDPASTPGYEAGKKAGQADLARGAARFDELQERLYAQSRSQPDAPAVLLVLQAMDSAGKGGIVRHVIGATDPQGVHLKAFKKPSPEELAHDFLWRIEKEVPDAGYIGVFDRSHYEDVLIGRVRQLAPAEEIERRYAAIVDFEQRAASRGIHIVKVMLHISGDEQKARLGERLERPDKHWKYNPGDVDERELWPAYMEAYQAAFDRTSTDEAPWYVVPANHKWYARLAVQALLIDVLERIDPQWPAADFDVEAEKARLAAT
ncbi:polyphosphate kinase 2 family protein [Microbacterium sp. EYE_5]|uniref:polyphosphate kinase 2 family protein n=1 Tax=unclassified Microbacterium TaxID=2609290 RepID=UPI00200576C8|nr:MULTISPECIES: polyphosphate kinase 2 family protein [unclassified Microbacterium]MCK6080173.1 polyphosphate kinase 2 family protein [Microbacterium sp. EYE_382]MCK6085444.1 polyphosphate kinase 2 family protein [Microbacterium sp. EYE_384]MCK6122331.1 polyphosphate kinase 2 family protein [Microbacterium sp. EYE_80]MCK6126207.1 polyphosphate kinase 2 family protein [Microbacterium sp. EYE_79]MCK6141128.1 polyphosphate kinase 2 family protein [Microbacterium sp. EYE_39]